MRHPAEHFIKYLIIKDPNASDAQILKQVEDWGFLSPQDKYMGFLRQEITPPTGFNPLDRANRPSMKFLRDEQVYELFYPTVGVEESWDILSDPSKRMAVEQCLLAKLDCKLAAHKLNKRTNWKLTADGIEAFGRFFWNVNLLTFDEWGRFLYGRSALYERYVDLLQAPPSLAFHHLRLEQTIESKKMIQRAQEIAYFALEEIALKPGVPENKVKAIGVLTKSIVECHNALSTSDMALKDVLKQFERFRMDHSNVTPQDIKALAPSGNFSGGGNSGATLKKADEDVSVN